ncbi:hypothetical protein NECAME_04560 [Necator americanus]|uniref:Uncharacterized protein n=1 Tax=Necator americanus TaxID=51031 RepID=W2SSL7_NECAM|nr:hypothetical protein NECAME_04560 [Necator americanus]ETN71816.1 hypothetical protein NECAME_04560 [Necator americanus]
MKAVARYGPQVNACVVVIPIILVFISNAMLIYTIRRRTGLASVARAAHEPLTGLPPGQTVPTDLLASRNCARAHCPCVASVHIHTFETYCDIKL